MLLSQLGIAAVTGLAGPGAAGAADTYITDPTTKIATEAKHYAVYESPPPPFVQQTVQRERV